VQTLVGRQREIEELTAGLEAAGSGKGSLFLIAGEPGVGKTHLVGDLARRSVEAGAGTFWGRCWEGGGAPSYWPWVQILRAYVREADRKSVVRHVGSGAEEVASLVPELREIIGAGGEPSTLTAESARFALFDAVTTFLKNAAHARPLTLLIDDLHAADLPSLLLADFLANEIADVPLLVVGAYREREAKRNAPAAEILARIVSRVRRIELTGLDESEIGPLIEVTTGRSASAAVSSEIFRTTEGNALYTREVARLLVSQGQLTSDEAVRIPIPESVREAIRLRLAPLQPQTRGVLAKASVVGREFDFALLGRVTEVEPQRLLDVLSPAVASGIVGDIPTALGRYTFSHALIRETLYDDLDPADRQRIHLQVARSLEDLYGPDPPRLAEIAHHFFQAGVAGDLGKAVEYGAKAADRALAMLAYEDAASLYDRAAYAVRVLDPPDEGRRCELLVATGDAQSRAGDVAGARESFLAAAEMARKLDRPKDLASAALGLGLEFTAYSLDEVHVSLLEEALQRLEERDDPLRARVLSQLGRALYFSDELERSAALAGEALAMARRIGDPSVLAVALCDRHQAVWRPDNPQERLAMATEIVELAQATGDRELMLQGLGWRITDRLELGDVADADADVDAFDRLARELRQPRYLYRSAINRAVRAAMKGQFTETDRLSQEALEVGQRAGDQGFLVNYFSLHGMTLAIQGRLTEFAATFQLPDNAPGFSETARIAMALGKALAGDRDGARPDYERHAGTSFASLRRDHAWLSLVCGLAQMCWLFEDKSRAGRLAEMLAPFADNFCVTGRFVTGFMGPVMRYLAMLHAILGRWDEAIDAFEDAIASMKRMACPPIMAQTQADYARALVLRGNAGDRERATVLLSSAVSTARTVSMTDFADSTVRDAVSWGFSPEEIGAKFPVEEGAPTRSWVLVKEGDYWSVGREGALFRLKDLKGFRYLATLLAQPGAEFHVLDMVGSSSGGGARRRALAEARSGDVATAGWGDAGAMLDPAAKAAYKRRLDDLREEIDEAESWGDAERASRARAEIEQLAEALAQGVGLGGRDRRAASAAERARVSVTKAINAAIDKISEKDGAIGRHLANGIRTGAFCSYEPDPTTPVTWRL
jgi:tetratricopeptide (TPR) repeat protein